VFNQLQQRNPTDILVCSVVLGELWYGAERSEATRRASNHALVNELEAKYESIPFDNAAAREYAVIRAELSQAGRPIGPNDTMIAAITRSRGVTLVTKNLAEFRRVTGILIEDWQTS
jgi:tRNA(fMet)-specific endonuclease VapC